MGSQVTDSWAVEKFFNTGVYVEGHPADGEDLRFGNCFCRYRTGHTRPHG
jgi:hypothetical protein